MQTHDDFFSIVPRLQQFEQVLVDPDGVQTKQVHVVIDLVIIVREEVGMYLDLTASSSMLAGFFSLATYACVGWW